MNIKHFALEWWRDGRYAGRQPGRIALMRWLGWFGSANLLLFLLVSLRYLQVVQLPEAAEAWLFAPLLFVGHFASMLFLLFSLLLLPLLLLLPYRQLAAFSAVVLASALLFALLADTFVYAQYRFHINGGVLNLLFGNAASEVFSFSWGMIAAIGLFALAVIVIELLLVRLTWGWVHRSRERYFGPWLAVFLVAAFLAENIWYVWADATSDTMITAQTRYLPGYHPVQARTYLVDWGLVSEEEMAQSITLRRGSNLRYPLAEMACASDGRPLNVVYIVIDSWRFDAMDETVTPGIYRLSRESLNFHQHFSGGNSTRTGLFSIFYGLPGTYWHAMLNEERSAVLMDRMIARDYALGIFASAKLTGPEFDRTIFSGVKDLRKSSRGDSPQARDQNITEEFVKFLDGQLPDSQQPFFGFLFYDAPHAYAFPEDYPTRFEPLWKQVNYLALNKAFDPQPFINRYRTSVHFSDSLVTAVLEKLASRQLMDNTVVVITGDHGQEFNDNKLNYWGHNGNFTRYQTQVPLIIHWPGRGAGDYDHITSHMDLAPTMLSQVLGCTNPATDYSVGKSLFDTQDPPFLLLSNYGDFAVKEKDKMTVVNQFGQVSVVDDSYRPISDVAGAAGSSAMFEALQLNSRFYRN